MYTLAPDALEANRRGALTDVQHRGLQAFVRAARRSQLSVAAFIAAGALLIAFSTSHRVSRVERGAFSAGGFALAAIIAGRALSGGDALSRDLRGGRVDAIEGAIGKRVLARARTSSVQALIVGGRRFRVARSTYQAAPDAGYVRLYYLPRSRKIVNLEQLPDRPVAEGAVSLQGLARAFGSIVRAPAGQQRDEARAELAGLAHAMEAMFIKSPVPPPAASRDPRPLSEAILGRWTNGFISVDFGADGTVTLLAAGREQRGRWSVGSDGRLHADPADGPMVATAWIAGDQLTIALDGQGMTLRR